MDPSDIPCRHRGSKLRKEPCGYCGRRNKKIQVFECSVFGECSCTAIKPRYENGGKVAVPCCINCEFMEKPAPKQTAFPCVYLGKLKEGKTLEDDRQIFPCAIHGSCVKEAPNTPLAACETCKDRLETTDSDFASKWQDQLRVLDRHRNATHALRDMLAGGDAFIVCGGPSAKNLPLEQLNQRGCWSMAVNNKAAWAQFKPNAFICADPPLKFHNGIWMDPSIMKFVPIPKLSRKLGSLRIKVGDGFFPLTDDEGGVITTMDVPNVWAYSRRSWLRPDDSFFLEPEAAWGNHNYGVELTGLQKTVMTLLLAMRVVYYLGARRIFLVGVDFFMDPKARPEDNYSFGEHRDFEAIRTNNGQFRIVNDWLCKMISDGVFDKFGLKTYNCNETSGLRAFAHAPFEAAVQEARKHISCSEPFDCKGWYTSK